MEKKLARIALLLVPAIGFFLAPATALASPPPTDTATWDLFQTPDVTTPYQTAVPLSFALKNTTGHKIDAIGAYVPNLHSCILVTALNGSTTGVRSATCTSGVSGFDVPMASPLAPGAELGVYLTLNIGCITYPTDPTCDSTPNISTNGDWVIHMYHFADSTGPFTDTVAVGNVQLTIASNGGVPTTKPLNWGEKNQYGDALNNSGITSPTAIAGLFPPGPLDSLIILPITLTNQILTASSGSVVLPTTTVFGRTMTFPTSAGVYGVIGTTATGLISAGLSFFLLYPWLKSIFGRLQRATSLKTHHDDTWGVL